MNYFPQCFPAARPASWLPFQDASLALPISSTVRAHSLLHSPWFFCLLDKQGNLKTPAIQIHQMSGCPMACWYMVLYIDFWYCAQQLLGTLFSQLIWAIRQPICTCFWVKVDHCLWWVWVVKLRSGPGICPPGSLGCAAGDQQEKSIFELGCWVRFPSKDWFWIRVTSKLTPPFVSPAWMKGKIFFSRVTPCLRHHQERWTGQQNHLA